MKWFKNVDWFWIFVIFHLFTREWPYGNTLQTLADLAILGVAIYSFINKYGR